jgi:hypothetical protein
LYGVLLRTVDVAIVDHKMEVPSKERITGDNHINADRIKSAPALIFRCKRAVDNCITGPPRKDQSFPQRGDPLHQELAFSV